MLQQQITDLKEKEESLEEEINKKEEEMKAIKLELHVIRRARKSMEKYEEQLNGEVYEPAVSY